MLKKLVFIKLFLSLTLLLMASGISAEAQVNTTIVDRLECVEDCEQQYKKLRRYARNGSPRAATLVGLIYKTGEFDREPDPDEAWRWMKRAKLQQFAPAMYYISEWYREGYRTEVDVERADGYLQRSADKGYIPAIFQLGMRKMENEQHEEGMALINVALKAKYPLAIQFNDMLITKFDEQELLSTDGTLVLSGNSSTVAETAVVSQAETETPENTTGSSASSESESENTLVVYGTKEDPQLLFVNLLKELEDIAMFNKRGYTGSRLGYLKCGMPGSACRTVKFEDGFSYDTFLRSVFGIR
ncbi:MAG: hypothetical protein KJO69_06415 [Gammaproteobacteria bacterium]|nr:hypothetical protein [Gammaproteobacteria bacterium]NNJ71873.1 sel1 repeat family protein [Enterobacterales bacterium]